jgi:hypothetical protein
MPAVCLPRELSNYKTRLNFCSQVTLRLLVTELNQCRNWAWKIACMGLHGQCWEVVSAESYLQLLSGASAHLLVTQHSTRQTVHPELRLVASGLVELL